MAIGRVSTNGYATARFIVDTNGISTGATHSTIAAAIADASAGSTIFIRPGTYTENLTLKASVDLVSYEADAMTPNVTIVGKCTATFAGTCTIQGIRLKTNSDNFLAVSGSSATIVYLIGCFLDCADGTGINHSSSSGSSQVEILNCYYKITGANTLFTVTSPGIFGIEYLGVPYGTSSTATASTNSASHIRIYFSYISFPLTTSSGGVYEIYDSTLDTATINVACLTTAGTGASSAALTSLTSGSAAAVSIGAGTTVGLAGCIINSDNTNALTGAGTLNYSLLSFQSSSGVNVTTQNIKNEGPSRTIGNPNSGNTNTLTVTNSSNTASSNAKIVATVGGTSSADAFYQAVVAGTTTWSWGVDNSDSDAYVLSASATPGTTNVMRVSTAGEINYPLQPAFLAASSTGAANVTGDGTAYTIAVWDTEVFDQNADFASNTFTAPVTGRYHLEFNLLFSGILSTHTEMYAQIVTGNRNYLSLQMNPYASAGVVGGQFNNGYSALCDMDAADTATTVFAVNNGTKVVDFGSGGVTDPRSWFSGSLAV